MEFQKKAFPATSPKTSKPCFSFLESCFSMTPVICQTDLSRRCASTGANLRRPPGPASALTDPWEGGAVSPKPNSWDGRD